MYVHTLPAGLQRSRDAQAGVEALSGGHTSISLIGSLVILLTHD